MQLFSLQDWQPGMLLFTIFIINLLQNRRQSFKSLFSLLLQNTCPYFYLSHTDFTIVFFSPSIGGHQDFVALINKSKPGMRNHFKKQGFHFTTPLDDSLHPQKTTEKEDEDSINLRNELKELQTKNHIQTRMKRSNTGFEIEDNSLVQFKGEEAIRQLFRYIIQYSFQEEIPQLLSPIPFLNSSLKQVEIKGNSKRTRKVVAKQHKDAMEDKFCLEVGGPLTIWNIMQLCDLFQQTQNGSFSVSLKTVKDTTNFNFVGLATTFSTKSSKNVTWSRLGEGSPLEKLVVKRAEYQKGKGYRISTTLKK
jgi:hypothetical protein